jgi:hypothetical protein
MRRILLAVLLAVPAFSAVTAVRIVERTDVQAGKPFQTMVPQVDADGNELAGVRLPEVKIPLGAYVRFSATMKSYGS